jgi:hypothetical protein
MTCQASEIEITDEMVQAGRNVLVESGALRDGLDYRASFRQPPGGDDVADLARDVIRAALACSSDRLQI